VGYYCKLLNDIMLVILRVIIGWYILYEGVAKVLNPDWTSYGFLLDSKGFMSALFIGIATNPVILQIVDFLNQWGLIAIGLGLIIGLFTKLSIIAGMALISFYYLAQPPFTGLSYVLPTEGSYLIVNKNLIQVFSLAVLLVFPANHIIGLDRFFLKKDRDKG
jgi:thiosulfate dehydrogenase (quinone) large subunit